MSMLNLSKNKAAKISIAPSDSSVVLTFTRDELRINMKSGLMFALELDEISGAVAEDSNGSNDWNNYDASIGQPGKINYSYFFGDTVNGYLEYPSTLISDPSFISFTVWFKHDGTYSGGEPAVIFMDGAETDNTIFQVSILNSPDTGKVRFYLRDENLEATYVTSESAYDDNQWHLLVAIKDGNNISLYVDDAFIGTDSRSFANFDFTKTVDTHYPRIAQTLDAVVSRQQFLGWLDQTCMWNIPLDADQRSKLYGRGNGKSYAQW